jgi:hypothetical protein
METYEPLTPPEYKRNELGQFDRPGKELAKGGRKKRALSEQGKKACNIPDEKRAPGRPPGSANKITVALREAILRAGEEVGGKEGLVGYLKMLARDNSSAYAGLLAKILPHQLASEDESNGGIRAEIRFVRELVWPSGHREIEGVTPKALPAPEPDESKAIEP